MFFYEWDGAGAGGGEASAEAPRAGSWSWAQEDGTFNAGWLDKMPDGLRDNPSLRVVGSLPDLAKSYVETKAMIGKRLEMPGENASPEQLASWRRAVGAPDSVEGYLQGNSSLRPEVIPEGLWDTAGERQFLAIAHKHSLPPAAVKDILSFYGDNVAAGLRASQASEAEVLRSEGAKLHQAFGQDYGHNMALAARVAVTVGLDPQTHPMFTSAEAVQAFAKIGRLMSEDRLVRGDAAGISGSIRDRIHDITDPSSSSAMAREYRGDYGPERQAAAQRQLHDLYAAAEQK